MDTLDMWYKITSKTVCDRRDCYDCHQIYGTNDCPDDIRLSNEEIGEFVKRITKHLRMRKDELPFDDIELTDDEFVDILMSD